MSFRVSLRTPFKKIVGSGLDVEDVVSAVVGVLRRPVGYSGI